MPRAASGTCTLAEPAFVTGTTIVSADVNSDLSDIVTMLSDSLSRSGKGGMTADLDMNSHLITELTSGTAAGHAVGFGQIQPGNWWVIAGGTANAITAGYSPAITALLDGHICHVRAASNNTSTVPTFSPNGLTPRAITKYGAVALNVNDIIAQAELILRYNLSATRWELLNPSISLNNLGAIAGAPVGKTAAYTVVNADKGKTFYLGGSAFYTFTVGAPASYDSDFQIRVFNQDARGKLMTVVGVTAFIMWPNQSVVIVNTGGVWQLSPLYERWITNAAITVYVNETSGSDSNDGLATGSGALATIGKAYSNIRDYMDHSGGTPTIQLAAGVTFNCGAGVNITYPLVGSRQLQINGGGVTSIVSCTAGGMNFAGRDLSTFTVSNLKITTTGNGSTALSVSNHSTGDVGAGVTFDDYPLGIAMDATTGGTINVLAGYTMSGTTGSNLHIRARFAGFISYGAYVVTLTSAQAFTVFAVATDGGYINAGGAAMTFAGAGSGGGSTGQRYNSSNNAVMNTSTTVYPGNAAGATATGGIYT